MPRLPNKRKACLLRIVLKENDLTRLFLDKQIQVYKERLEAGEEALKKFKLANSGVLPSQSNTFFQRLERANSELAAGQLLLMETTRKFAGIEEELKNVSKTAVASQGVSPTAPVSPLQERINTLQEQLDELTLRYTDKHPDVIATGRMLEQLIEKQQSSVVTDADSVEAAQMAVNPAYQQLTVLKGETKANLAALQARVAELTQRRDALQVNVDTIPELETEYLKLTRDFGITQQTYDELVKRREAARLAQRADESSDKVQFRIIEPPVLPLLPSGPNRLLFSAIVFLGALGAGAGVAWLLAQLKPAFYTRDQLVENYDWPVLGMVSMVWSPEQIASRRKELVVFLALFALLVMMFVANIARIFLTGGNLLSL